MAGADDPDTDRDALRTEAEQLAKAIRGHVIVLIGISAFLFVTLNVSDAQLFAAADQVDLPVYGLSTTLSSLIALGPAVLVIFLFYMHFLVGRLEELARRQIFAPQIYFFTMRSAAARLAADAVFYFYVPAFCIFFFVRTHSIYRPEAPVTLALLAVTFLVCSALFFERAWLGGSLWRRVFGAGYLAAALVAVTVGGWKYATEGRAPFQTLAAHFDLVDLAGADLASLLQDEDLRDFVFDDLCLRGTNFAALDLSNVSFKGADLSEANFENARLTRATFDDATLTGANLAGAILHDVSLRNASLSRVEGNGAEFDGSDLKAAEFGEATLRRTRFLRADATNADFSSVDLDDARLSGATLDGANFGGASARRTLFQGARASAASFCLADLEEARFTAAELSGADFARSSLYGARFDHADLTGATFANARTDERTRGLAGVLLDGPTNGSGRCAAGGRLPEHRTTTGACDR